MAWRLHVREKRKSDKRYEAENILKTRGRGTWFLKNEAGNLQKTNPLTKIHKRKKVLGQNVRIGGRLIVGGGPRPRLRLTSFVG
jgi:hypothetical protein